MNYTIARPPALETEHPLSDLPPLLQTLLLRRGMRTKEDAERFLKPDWERDTHDPFRIHNMEKAVSRILSAIDAEERIVVYSDYDCDGIPGNVILHDLFKKIGYENVRNYIPHRHEEGYGLNIPAVEKFAEEGAAVLITVDVGITDVDAVARAGELGIDVIVTDHHLPIIEDDKEILPPAFAVINSKQAACEYPDEMLCGAAVAFKFAQAILMRGRAEGMFLVPEGWEKWLLDMAGLSTIADMVPLVGENRVLASYGLRVMRKSRRKGLRTLLRHMNTRQEHLAEDDVGFMIAPRLNAAGRLDDPFRAFELLTADDDAEAERLSKHLHSLNDRRKGLVASMIQEARKTLSARELREVVAVGDPRWQPGLLGLVANKIMEEYDRPAFVWGRDGSGTIKGSCRSDGTISVVELMAAVPEGILLHFGGHEASGGFSVHHEHIHILEDALHDTYQKLPKQEKVSTVTVDAELTLDDVSWETYSLIDSLAPFGMGNEKPVFLFREVEVEEAKTFGKTAEHLRIDMRDGRGRKVSSIMFFAPKEFLESNLLLRGVRIDLLASFERSFFRGRAELRLRIVNLTVYSGGLSNGSEVLQ